MRPHLLRHPGATGCQIGMRTRLIQDFLGHVDISPHGALHRAVLEEAGHSARPVAGAAVGKTMASSLWFLVSHVAVGIEAISEHVAQGRTAWQRGRKARRNAVTGRWSVSSRGRPCPQCLCPVPMSRYLVYSPHSLREPLAGPIPGRISSLRTAS